MRFAQHIGIAVPALALLAVTPAVSVTQGIAFVTSSPAMKRSASLERQSVPPAYGESQRRRLHGSSRLFLERGNQHKPEGSIVRHDHNNPAPMKRTNDDSATSKTSTGLSGSMFSGEATMPLMQHKVFCDLDGVLVDFEHGVQALLNRPTSKLDKGTMWKHVARANAFFEHLPWTRDGRQLWEAIRKLNPDILTGVPSQESSRIEKFNWCLRELGLDQDELHHVDMAAGYWDHESVNGNVPMPGVTNIITCWSDNKHMECTSRAVLIDDRDSLRETWEQAGGIFIHHVDTKTTLRRLREYGIL